MYAALLANMLTASGQAQAKDTFKSSDFLEWKEESRQSYIRIAVGMAGLVSARNDKKHSKCIDNWYSDEKKSIAIITKAMRDNPTYHPRAIILAVMQKVCGSFTYNKK